MELYYQISVGTLSSFSCINEYLTIDSGGNVTFVSK